MAGGSVIRGGNGWKVDNGQRLFSFVRNRSREQGGGSRRKDSQHSRFFALKYFCSSEKLKNPAAFVELPPSSLSLSLYESSLTLEKRRERGRDFVFDDKHRVPLRESFHSFSWLSARIHAHARLNSRYACIFLCASWFHNSLSIYIYIYIEASIDGRQLIPRRGTIILSACVSSSHTLTPSLFLRTKFSFSRPDFHHYDQIPFSPSPSCYHFPPSLSFGSLVREEEIFNNIYSTIRSTREDKFSSREKCLAYQSNFFHEILSPV